MKIGHFRTFLKFHFIASFFFTVAKEWATNVSAFYMKGLGDITLGSWNSSKINLYSNYKENTVQ